MRNNIRQYFQLNEHNTNIKQECIAGSTTFLTMAYIIFINPSMLANTGMDHGAVFVATCLAAAIGCLIMGLLANYPIALAPGMGLNAFFTYTVVLEMGYNWQIALGAVFLSGMLFIILSLFNIRAWLINSIPEALRIAISAGIGFFLAFIALKNAGIIVANPATLVMLGELTHLPSLLASLGLLIIVMLMHKGVPGSIMIAILSITLLAWLFGDVQYQGIMSLPPSILPTFMQLDIAGALSIGMVTVVLSLLLVDLFDSSGTLISVAQRGNLLNQQGQLPRLKKTLLADSSATVAGSFLGTSTTTSYIESSAGVDSGGRTGLTAVVVALFFLLALLFSPLAAMVPIYATSAPLFYVAVLMLAGLSKIKWHDISDAIPVVITCIIMPLSFSITEGIALGFISYTAIKICCGRWQELSKSTVFLALLFIAKFSFLP